VEKWLKIGLFSFLLTLILGFLATIAQADPDLWGYLAFGRLFWHSQTFPYQDSFSYLPTIPWVYHEWLTGVVFYPIYQTLGFAGLQVLKYILGLGTAALIYRTARERGAYPLAAAAFLIIIFNVARNGYSPVRAQVFTFFFFAFFLYLLERARRGGGWRGLYLIPLIVVFWCNLHGGFLAGLGLVAIYAVGEFLARRRSLPYLSVLLLSIPVTLINPYGVEYWQYLYRAVTMPRPHITEWASVLLAYQTNQANLALLIFLFVLIFVGLFGMWQSHWRDLTAGLALAATMFLGFKHIRHLPFFLILAGAYLPVCLNMNVDFLQSLPWIKKIRTQARVKIGVLALLGLLTAINLSSFALKHPFDLKLGETAGAKAPLSLIVYPVAAVDLIKQMGFSGKILTKFDWGEYLIWDLQPQCLVALDGRYETVYSTKVANDYFEFCDGGPRWRQFLHDYPPDLILMDRKMAVVALIQKDPHWRQVYADANCVLFQADKRAGETLAKKSNSLETALR
jgi:hypothetical protein